MAYKAQVERLNEWGANSNTTKQLGKLGPTNNTGNFGTILDMIITALNGGFSYVTSASATNGVLPSATASTYGAPFVVSPTAANSTAVNASTFQTASVSALKLSEITFAITCATETITAQVTVTYNDGTTAAIATKTTTSSTTLTYATADLVALYANGKYISSVACAIKSSISSSTATATVTVYGDSTIASVQIPALV